MPFPKLIEVLHIQHKHHWYFSNTWFCVHLRHPGSCSPTSILLKISWCFFTASHHWKRLYCSTKHHQPSLKIHQLLLLLGFSHLQLSYFQCVGFSLANNFAGNCFVCIACFAKWYFPRAGRSLHSSRCACFRKSLP